MPRVEVIKPTQNAKSLRQHRGQKKLRVAAYCRVSTDHDDQKESYDSQCRHYTDLIQNNKEWEMVRVYADEAISGTSIDKREDFKQMISDCLAGKIDFIITKSISRFARNTLDVLTYVRMLIDHHVAIRFEEENIDTMKMDGELILSILSAVYQQEVVNTSAHVKKGLKMRMQRGELVGFPGCLGYDYDPVTKSLTINQEEAKIVRLIFELYAQGYGAVIIGRELEKRGYKTRRGNKKWGITSILTIIGNEKYIGDLRQGKSFIVDPIRRRRLENYGDVEQFYVHDHHEPIIERELFEKAQNILKKRQTTKKNGPFELGVHVDKVHRYNFSGMLQCGFCGASLSRKSWPRLKKTSGVFWGCLRAVKEHKQACPHSKNIAEKIIETAFVESYRRTCESNSDIVKEAIARLKRMLESQRSEENIAALQKEIDVLQHKLDRLLDMRLEGIVTKESYEAKHLTLKNELEAKKYIYEEWKHNQGKQDEQERRLKKFQAFLEHKATLDEFDPDVFLDIVDHVEIGGFDESGNPEPTKITFYYKTGSTDEHDALKYKPKRRKPSGGGGIGTPASGTGNGVMPKQTSKETPIASDDSTQQEQKSILPASNVPKMIPPLTALCLA